MLEIITYNPTLERVGASNRYISHGQSSSHKASFEIELGLLDFNICKYCIMGKQCRVRFKTATHKTKGILDYVHLDIWGPVDTNFIQMNHTVTK